MIRTLLIAVLLLSCVQLGCTARSQQRVRTYVDQGTQSVNENTTASYAIARVLADTPEDRAVVDSYETSFKTFAASQRAEFAKLRQEIEAERQKRIELINAIAGIATSAVPGGSTAFNVVQALGKHISNTGESAEQVAEQKSQELAGRIETIEKSGEENYEAVNKKVADLSSEVQKLIGENATEQTLAQKQKEFEDRVRGLSEEKQAQLRTSLIQRVEAMGQEQRAAFEIEFKSKLLEVAAENNFTQEQIDQIKQTDAGDLLAEYGLGGAGGVIGILALMRTFGKSRSKEEIEEIKQEVKKLDKDVAVARNAPGPGLTGGSMQ